MLLQNQKQKQKETCYQNYCQNKIAPSGNRNRGISLEAKYVTTTPKVLVENEGIDPSASCMQSRRSTIWANPPYTGNYLRALPLSYCEIHRMDSNHHNVHSKAS